MVNRTTPSGELAAAVHEGLSEQFIQAFPSQRAVQQSVQRERLIKDAKRANDVPEKLELVSKTTVRSAHID